MLCPKIDRHIFGLYTAIGAKLPRKTLARRPHVNPFYDPRFNQLPSINFKSQKLVKPQLFTSLKALS